MARMLVKFGAAANDKTGDSARTGAQKINSNFLELYAFLSGNEQSEILPVAIPVSRGGTGAATKEGARQSLGLGDASTRDVGENENDVMVIGTYGFGTDLSPALSDTELKPIGDFKSGELGYFGLDDISTLTLGTRTSETKGQIGLKGIGKGTPVPVYRGNIGTDLTPWYEVYGQGNAIVTVNGNIKAAANSARITWQNCITQHGEALGFTRNSEGNYTILDALLNQERWTKEVPVDEEGVPLFKAVLVQNGTGLNVTVTKDGVPIDIPAYTWIDVCLRT